ncbi:MAG TPA: hypothetical protein VNJ11_02800 [Bryobacteraceae bacterium]|nr:hypothetical protein [Bryobacteraceae bacterium]
MRRKLAALVPLAILGPAGCSRSPDLFTPPIERKPLTGAEPTRLRAFVAMSDPDAEIHLVGGVNRRLEAGAWRWASGRAELQFVTRQVRGIRFVADVVVAEATFAQTGPVTLAFSVNGRPLGALRFETPGPRRFEQPVPDGWLHAGELVRVTIEADKVYVDPRDGTRLGFILHRAGFLP